jgi:hypothetical protein
MQARNSTHYNDHYRKIAPRTGHQPTDQGLAEEVQSAASSWSKSRADLGGRLTGLEGGEAEAEVDDLVGEE